MNRRLMLAMMMILLAAGTWAGLAMAADKEKPTPDKDGWYSLFDGKSLDGWKVNENPKAFAVDEGRIVAFGDRSHLFYAGPVEDAAFKDFEFKAEVMTTPGSNSGLYFHTKFQASGWPNRGYEAQVNNTHGDPKKTGGLYNVKDNFKTPVKDNEWFNYYIKVKGKQIIIKINDQTLVDYTEPADLKRPERQLSTGTFAIQAHDPKSKVYFRAIKVKPLKD